MRNPFLGVEHLFVVTALVLASALTGPLLHGATLRIPVRLQGPLSSYQSKAGNEFETVVIAGVESRGKLLVPAGSIVRGRVRKARSVGIGFLHERALLDLDFFEYVLPDGQTVAMNAQVHTVDNAREEVTGDGKIRGILAASGAPALVRGIWRVPSLAMFHRTSFGLCGAGLRIWSEFGLGPIGSAGLLAFRWLALTFPEPEIVLPRGTELTLAVTSMAPNPPEFQATPVPEKRSEELAQLPARVLRPNGKAAGDMINLRFTGTREDLASAFGNAGWKSADTLSRGTFRKFYQAFTSMHGYPKAPVSKLMYGDRPPDLVFQKSLNTVGKRHHIRVWKGPGEDVWLGSATHDVGVALDPSHQVLTHRIDADIDEERDKVVNDLVFAGCVGERDAIARPQWAHPTTFVDGVRTDGRLMNVELRICDPREEPEADTFAAPGNRGSRFLRRFLLETKHYVIRDNAYHWGYRAVRAMYRRLPSTREATVAAKVPPVPRQGS